MDDFRIIQRIASYYWHPISSEKGAKNGLKAKVICTQNLFIFYGETITTWWTHHTIPTMYIGGGALLLSPPSAVNRIDASAKETPGL